MLDGVYQNPTIFYFGRDSELNIVHGLSGKKVLLHYGVSSIIASGLYEKIVKILNNASISFVELGGVEANPKSDLVHKGIEIAKQHGIDFILAVGGGSVIDSAKAIAVGARFDGDFFDLFLGKAKPQDALEFGVVLTNAGAGSETSDTSVITHKELATKKAFSSPLMRAKFAVLNPENTVDVPIHTTMCGIVDSISHVFERYFSNTEFVDCSDRLAEGLMQTLMKYALLIKDDPKNYDYRAEIMWACKMATDQLVYFGRKQEWTCHYIAHEIGAICDKPHGEILGVIFPAWMRYVCSENEHLFLQFSKRVFNVDSIDDGIREFQAFLIRIGMPTSLEQIDFTNKSDFEKIASNLAKINPSGTIGNFKRLTKSDLINILNNKVLGA